MSRLVIAAGLKLIVVPIDSTRMRRSLASGSRAKASHASRARAGRSRQRQSKWAGSTRRCTRTALVTAPFGTIPGLQRVPMRLFPLGLPEWRPTLERHATRGNLCPFFVASILVSWRILMSSFQRLAAVTDASANLIAQLRELNELRERLRKAELARSPRVDRRRRTRIRWPELRRRLRRR
jgi:hypothetical protein